MVKRTWMRWVCFLYEVGKIILLCDELTWAGWSRWWLTVWYIHITSDLPVTAITIQNCSSPPSHLHDCLVTVAGLLSIKAERDMGDEVWQDLAESLGYTQREITKFSSFDEPLMMMIGDYKKRGGQAHKFIEALYRTGPQDSGLMGLQKMRPHVNSTHVTMEEGRAGLCSPCSPNSTPKEPQSSMNLFSGKVS